MRYALFSLSILAIFIASCSSFFSEKNGYHCSKVNKNSDDILYPAVIFGGGVAGLTAANYLAQANIPCLLIEGNKPGGALAQSHSVRNWPGEIDISGSALVKKIKNQVLAAGVVIDPAILESIDCSSWPYSCILKDRYTGTLKKIKMLSCIIALGAEPHYLGIPGEREYWGKGVTNCAVCDGSLYVGKNVVVIGGGDSAVVEALYLADIAKKVTVVVRKDRLRAKDKRKVAELLARTNVTFVFNTDGVEVCGNDSVVTAIVFKNNKTGLVSKTLTDGVFLAIGSSPNSIFFRGILTTNKQGYITLVDGQQTSRVGIFAAGDIVDPLYKQAVTAASDGCKAALQLQNFLRLVGYELILLDTTKKNQRQAVQGECAASQVISITAMADFTRLLAEYELPIVLEIGASLCIDCQVLEPIVEKTAIAMQNQVIFAKINISDRKIDPLVLATILSGAPISKVPLLLLIKQGKEIARITDVIDEKTLKMTIERIFC